MKIVHYKNELALRALCFFSRFVLIGIMNRGRSRRSVFLAKSLAKLPQRYSLAHVPFLYRDFQSICYFLSKHRSRLNQCTAYTKR